MKCATIPMSPVQWHDPEVISSIEKTVKMKNCFSGLPSSVSNVPHLPFFQTQIKKSGLIYFIHMSKSNINIFILEMNSLVFDKKEEKSGLICFMGNEK